MCFFTDLIYEGSIIDSCTNLPAGSDNAASAADIDDACVDFYDDIDCTGRKLRLKATDRRHDDLSSHQFGSVISSYASCVYEPSSQGAPSEERRLCCRIIRTVDTKPHRRNLVSVPYIHT